jgi:hypothetical protein
MGPVVTEPPTAKGLGAAATRCQRVTGRPFDLAQCHPHPPNPGDIWVTNDLGRLTGGFFQAADLAKLVELRGFEPLTPSMRRMLCLVHMWPPALSGPSPAGRVMTAWSRSRVQRSHRAGVRHSGMSLTLFLRCLLPLGAAR